MSNGTSSFAGKTAFVVGAGKRGGIAFACAQRLAERGATVALADLPSSNVLHLTAQLPGGNAHSAHTLDVTDSASVQAAVAAVVARHGRIDAALLASAILRNQPFLEITRESWDQTIAVNLTGIFVVAQAVARTVLNRAKQAAGLS